VSLALPDSAQEAAWHRRPAVRTAVALGLVLLALAGARLVRRQEPVPPPPATGRIVFVDTAGWYGRTPDEVAVLTPFDLTIGGLPAALPLQLGPWQGFDRPHDTAVDVYLDRPELSIERTYRRSDGQVVWLTVFGSRGPKSFHLFEHTPETCYPLGGWAVQRFGTALLPLGPLPLPVNQGVAQGSKGSLVFLHFYVWDSPDRDSDRGVLTFRVAAPVTPGSSSTSAAAGTLALLAQDFVPRFMGTTVAWSRF
jgi:hypothetical protein